MSFPLKSLALCVLFSLHGQVSAADCSGNILLGEIDSGVADRPVNGVCVDELVQDAPNTWGSHGGFVAHVAQLTRGLVKAKHLSHNERALLVLAAARSEVGRTIQVKLIGFNDFHGYIKAGEGSGSNPGVARLATRINELRAQNPLNAVVSAGDMIGASPLTSALFKDEPTIEAMNRIAIDFNAVGNHEFDEGKSELLRLKMGGNHPADPYSGLGLAQDLKAGEFAGARFDFLAANVVESATGKTVFPAYGVKDFLGNKVAFIGMTLEGTPTIVSPSGVAGLEFKDEADTVNALIPQLQAQGIRGIVVLIHEGGFAAGGINGCAGVSGPIVEIVNRLDAEVDLVISGHTHQAYNCLIHNKAGQPVRVTSAGQYARSLTDIDMVIDTKSRNVLSVAANNLVTSTGAATPEDPALTDLVAHYDALAAEPKARVIGTITAAISRTQNPAGESALGDVIADAQLDATDDVGFGEAVMAFMNPGGIRADLPYNLAGAGFPHDGAVTFGDAFTVQPFGNALVTMTLAGAQIKTLLETQFAGCNGQTVQRILQVSDGFNYAYTAGNACDARVTAMSINGVPVDPSTAYRVTVNSFLADGGDGFVALKQGTDRLGGAVDLDAFEAYLKANPAGVAPGPGNRITRND